MDHQRKVSRHSNRRLLAHLLIAAAALAARWQYQIDQIQPLVELASDRVADF